MMVVVVVAAVVHVTTMAVVVHIRNVVAVQELGPGTNSIFNKLLSPFLECL